MLVREKGDLKQSPHLGAMVHNLVARDWCTRTVRHYNHCFFENLIPSSTKAWKHFMLCGRLHPPTHQVRNLYLMRHCQCKCCCALSQNSTAHTCTFNQRNLKISGATKFFMRLNFKRLLPNCSIPHMKVIIDHSWILHLYQLGILFTRVMCLCKSTAYTTLHYTTLHYNRLGLIIKHKISGREGRRWKMKQPIAKYTCTHHISIAVTTVSKLKKWKYQILSTHACPHTHSQRWSNCSKSIIIIGCTSPNSWQKLNDTTRVILRHSM